jgi:hypothetical protein
MSERRDVMKIEKCSNPTCTEPSIDYEMFVERLKSIAVEFDYGNRHAPAGDPQPPAEYFEQTMHEFEWWEEFIFWLMITRRMESKQMLDIARKVMVTMVEALVNAPDDGDIQVTGGKPTIMH